MRNRTAYGRPLVAVGTFAVIATLAWSAPASSTDFSNGFEADATGWQVFGGQFDATRVPSGTNGVPSSTGAYHGEAQGGNGTHDYLSAATNWGGYGDNDGCAVTGCAAASFPANGYITSLDIYLDLNATGTDDTRFDFSSAINKPDGSFLRDFVFNCGFYSSTDVTGPGAGQDRFICSASNNATRSSAYPKNPGRGPIAITQSGWYTFEHTFRDDGTGVLAVDLTILDSTGAVVNTWTLSDPADQIGVTVGGNRYGWIVTNEFPFLAIDNSVRRAIVDTSVCLIGDGATFSVNYADGSYQACDLASGATLDGYGVVQVGDSCKFGLKDEEMSPDNVKVGVKFDLCGAEAKGEVKTEGDGDFFDAVGSNKWGFKTSVVEYGACDPCGAQ